MSKKFTLEFVKEKTKELTDGKYECVSDEYISSRRKLKFKCPKGHIFTMSWSKFFRKGQRCSDCCITKKLTLEKVKDRVKKYSDGKIKCISTKYIDSTKKLLLECEKGHTFERTLSYITGRGEVTCPICNGVFNDYSVKDVKSILKRDGYIFLDRDFNSNHSKIKVKCPKGHVYKTTLSSFLRGSRCNKCHIESITKYVSREKYEEYVDYRKTVTRLSNINFIKHYYLINPFKLKRSHKDYHLDHIYSVIDGFEHDVDATVVSSVVNLRMLTSHDNISKNGDSHFSLETLLELHSQFKKETAYA